ncbi:MAG: exopolysaccharide biosynthesis protein [Oceanicaulis sp.]|jgi:hypothetical protein|nr:exopolysaccharide biosynthesis protein [Oceanicaulis sp.]
MVQSQQDEAGSQDAEHDQPLSLTAELARIAHASPEEGLSLGAFSDALGERVFGALLFALAIPVCMPFLYGVPQIVALPMMAIAVQMAGGRAHPWMPKSFRNRQLDKPGLVRIATWSRKWFGWLEALARPRLSVLSGPTAERIVGGVFVLFCASILVPLPATNTTPGIAIAIASIGLITRDGLLVLAGLVLGVVWVSLLVVGFTFFGAAFIDVLKTFILGMFGAGG